MARHRDKTASDADTIESPHLLHYANEKLGAAVQVLATHEGNVKIRLRFAGEHLAMTPPQGLPRRLRAEYESIWHELTKRHSPTDGIGALAMTLHRMRSSTAGTLAKRIYSLSCEVDYLSRH